MLEISHLSKRYNGITAVDDVNFAIRPGEILGYVGPNGAGKSTTVKMIIGLLEPGDGQILYQGRSILDDLAGFQQRLGYVPEDRPLWSIGDTRGVQHHLDVLSRLLANPRALADQIDRIDRCCEQLILESLLGAAAAPMEGTVDRVASVRRWIETHWRGDHDFDALARQHGLSPTHFRRLWQRSVGVPPHRFLIEERLRRACRALVQTDSPIAEIARAHGFPDPLYFSRKFRAFTGESASTYRQRYRASLQF